MSNQYLVRVVNSPILCCRCQKQLHHKINYEYSVIEEMSLFEYLVHSIHLKLPHIPDVSLETLESFWKFSKEMLADNTFTTCFRPINLTKIYVFKLTTTGLLCRRIYWIRIEVYLPFLFYCQWISLIDITFILLCFTVIIINNNFSYSWYLNGLQNLIVHLSVCYGLKMNENRKCLYYIFKY